MTDRELSWFDWVMLHVLFLPTRASTFATSVDHLHYFVIITTFVAAFLILTVMVVFAVVYRRRSEAQTTPAVRSNILAEGIFWLTPLGFFIAWFYMGYSHFVKARTPPPNTFDVYVMAKQWMWKFTYPDGPSSIGVLYVPEGRPVRLLMTSRDVIHSFFVPAFRLKQDVVPGRYTDMWFEATATGRYEVLCAEYCGLQHSNMRAEIVVMPGEAFDTWFEEQREGFEDRRDAIPNSQETLPYWANLRLQGERVAAKRGCFNCHSTDGSRLIGPTWLDLWMRSETLATGEVVIADDAYLTRSMMDPNAQIVAGFAPVMPTFQGILTPLETAALLEYIKSLRSKVPESFEERPAYVPAR